MKIKKNQYASNITYFFLTLFLLLSGCATQAPSIDIPAVEPIPSSPKKVEVALVLGAGGSRALTHLGVLEVLEEEGIPIDLIVGSIVFQISIFEKTPFYTAANSL